MQRSTFSHLYQEKISDIQCINSKWQKHSVVPQSDTVAGLENFKLNKIPGYFKRLFKKNPPYLELYVMLEIFSYLYDAVMYVKNIQQQYGNGNFPIGFGRAFGYTIEVQLE